MKKATIFKQGGNFILVKERESNHGLFGPVVIRTSGYTTTQRALKSSWLKTQIETIPQTDRYHLSDPVIVPQTIQKAFVDMDCNLFTLYFRPECRGLKYAMREFAIYLEEQLSKQFFKEYALIGHSKGGLFVAGLTKYLKKPTNILMIAPTFGTIMGNEQQVFKRLEDYKSIQKPTKKALITPEIALYKAVMHVIGSRRPVDKDMSIGSSFLLEELDLTNLSKHNAMLVTAECPKRPGISDSVFMHYRKMIGLDRKADGMVTLEEQLVPSEFVKKIINIEATHPTALNKANSEILYFLYDAFF